MKRLFFIISLLLCLPLAAQRSDFMRKEALMPLVERLTAFGKKIPQEKVYVHMDRSPHAASHASTCALFSGPPARRLLRRLTPQEPQCPTRHASPADHTMSGAVPMPSNPSIRLRV